MIHVPDYLFNEMLAVSKAMNERHHAGSIKHANAIRRAARIYHKLKELKMKKSLDGTLKIPKKTNLKDKLDRIFSEYIRRRDADSNGYVRCISCGKTVHWKEVDAGHYVNRKHMSLRWDEVNVNGQCRSCNRFDEGNMIGYARGLEVKYGKDAIGQLDLAKNRIMHTSDSYLILMIDHYRKKLKDLDENQ